MRFGFFDQLPCASGDSEQQRYRDIIAQIELGDALGFDTVWLGELHFGRAFSILATPKYCVERVQALRHDYGMDEFICYFNQGGIMDHAAVRRSMTLFAREVLPYCR